MNNKDRQIPLNFNPKPDYSRDDFMVSNCNLQAIRAIDSWPEWSFFAYVLYGPKGSGKSHLAHIFADHVMNTYYKPIAVKIINAKEITIKKANLLHEESPFLVVEDLNPKVDNEALFHLFNLYQNEGGHILFTAENAPARMHFKLPDLQSRLNIIPSIAIGEPDDLMLTALIVKLFTDRQIIISQEVLNYIIQNMQRSFSFALRLVEEIDFISMAKKRAVSVTIVKEAIEYLTANTQPDLFE
ncbi:MAG: DNA replication protein [Alphaproteobacteria bacterium]|nr:DNA replication protein [Alphaproteobacteria bacterium]